MCECLVIVQREVDVWEVNDNPPKKVCVLLAAFISEKLKVLQAFSIQFYPKTHEIEMEHLDPGKVCKILLRLQIVYNSQNENASCFKVTGMRI